MSNEYDEALKALSPPEPFDPRVFDGDDTCPQALCNFVLSMALLFNDFKDIVLGYRLVLGQIPEDRTPSKELGQAGGMSEHLYRLLMGVIHELLELIEKNRKVIAQPYFQRVPKKCTPTRNKRGKRLRV